MDRRTFIAAGSTALVGGLLGNPLRSDAAPGALSVRATPKGPLITPPDKFFAYSQMRYPDKLPDGIQIDGLVNTPARYSIDDLAKIPTIKKLLTLECYVNTAGGPLIFTTPFEGVPLSALFDKAGVKPEAMSARIECSDGHPPFLLPLTELRRKETMLVSKHGGQAVPMRHGSPYTRLFIPGAGGNHHPKWVSRITLVANKAVEHPAPPMAGFLSPAPPTVVGTMAGVTLTGYAYYRRRAGRQGRGLNRQWLHLPCHAVAAAARSRFVGHLGTDVQTARDRLLCVARQGHQRSAAANRTFPA